MSEDSFISYQRPFLNAQELIDRSENYFSELNTRRTVRQFSDQPVPRVVIENIIRTASSAPSGAHKQPWVFCAVSDPVLKTKIRQAAEVEEQKNYSGRMSDEWLEDLAVFDTDENKPNLEIAPWLIVVFKKPYDLIDGEKRKNYYVNESVGLATGFLLTAIHQSGLVSLTHTPSPMNFLEKLLDRPKNERAYLLIPLGYPADDAKVPNLQRKKLGEVSQFYE